MSRVLVVGNSEMVKSSNDEVVNEVESQVKVEMINVENDNNVYETTPSRRAMKEAEEEKNEDEDEKSGTQDPSKLSSLNTPNDPLLGDNSSVSSSNTTISINDLTILPPLPTPNYQLMGRQSAGGICLVMTIIISILGITHGITLTVGNLPTYLWWTVMILIDTLSLMALLCLLGIVFDDPGVIQRSSENCFPLPSMVNRALSNPEEHEPIPPHNISIDGDIFCTRCYVWRHRKVQQRSANSSAPSSSSTHPPCCKPSRAYHCNICQRCVKDFDHHCSVFGRCIAGRGWNGNMKYFVTILVIAVVASTICPIALIGSLVFLLNFSSSSSLSSSPARWILPICIIVVILWCTISSLNKFRINMCAWCRSLASEIFALFQHCNGRTSSSSSSR